MKIIGIDPGIGICGFGVIETAGVGSNLRVLDFGAVTTKVDAPMPSRLLELYESLGEVFDETKPDVVAVEKLFFSKNITTGIAVAEARGVVLLVAEQKGLPVFEYTPNEIKMTLTGYGSADKSQMQEMVRVQLGLKVKPKPDDAADALAAAITCGFLYKTGETGGGYKFSNSRLDFSLERKVQKKKPG
ncbi:crossover junction endodeoxyribonuclease RuvC [Candidatus Saccharibacteria bacterium]|nr:crossover junction endodeoxyribonuclease RuvC [Candidatus Saccharibacteria bacterium]